MNLVFRLKGQITFEVMILLVIAISLSSLFLGYIGAISKHYGIRSYKNKILNVRKLIDSSLLPYKEFRISVGWAS